MTLSARQEELLRMRAQGMSNAKIGKALGISQQTVKNHLTEAYARLGVDNIVDAMRVKGWVKVK